MKVNAQYAESHLADLLSAAYSGEEVEIEAPNKPALRLVISNPAPKPSATSQEPRQLGRLKGLIAIPTDEEWDAIVITTNHG